MKTKNMLLLGLLFFASSCGDDIDPIERDWQTPSDGNEEEVQHSIELKDNNVPFKDHPSALHSKSDIEYAKEKVRAGESPWIDGYNQILKSNHFNQDTKLPALQPNPTEKIVRGGKTVWEPDPDNYNNAANQAHAAYQYALIWKMTDNTEYAQAAINILNAWAETCKSLNGDSNVSLAAGLYGYQFANAGELMRDYVGWEADDFAAYQKWMVDVFYKVNNDFLTRHHGAEIMNYWANWDLANLASMLSIGILADRRDIYNQAVEYLLDGEGNGCLKNTIVHVFDGENEGLAQIQESGRDQGHSTLVIGLLGVIGQITWNQEDDFFGYNDNVILKAAEYVAKYNVAMLDVPFVYYNNPVHGLHTAVSDISRGSNRPMWEVIYAHYSTVKNVSPKWTQYTYMGVNTQRPETATQTGNSGGLYDLLGCGTMMFARQATVESEPEEGTESTTE